MRCTKVGKTIPDLLHWLGRCFSSLPITTKQWVLSLVVLRVARVMKDSPHALQPLFYTLQVTLASIE